MMGLQHCLANITRKLREEELRMASRVRWIMVYYNASGWFSPRESKLANQTDFVQ